MLFIDFSVHITSALGRTPPFTLYFPLYLPQQPELCLHQPDDARLTIDGRRPDTLINTRPLLLVAQTPLVWKMIRADIGHWHDALMIELAVESKRALSRIILMMMRPGLLVAFRLRVSTRMTLHASFIIATKLALYFE